MLVRRPSDNCKALWAVCGLMSISEVAGLQENTSDSADIFMAIEASIAALYVLATPGLPKQAYPEDTIERTVEVVKFHLMSNVMAFHDPRLCQIHRPQLLAGSGGAVHSSVLKMGIIPLICCSMLRRRSGELNGADSLCRCCSQG